MTTKKKKPALTPPDYSRCQCEITTTASFMQMGGPPKTTERCKNKPTMLMEERFADSDGQKGSMTVCDDCFKQAQLKTWLPPGWVLYSRITKGTRTGTT